MILMNFIQFVQDDVDHTLNNRRSVWAGIKRFFVNQVKKGVELLELLRVQSHHLLSCFLKKLKFIQIIDIGSSIQKHFFSKEKNPGIITCAQICKFPNG